MYSVTKTMCLCKYTHFENSETLFTSKYYKQLLFFFKLEFIDFNTEFFTI